MGPLKAKLQRDISDAEALVAKLKQMAVLQARSAMTTSANTGKWPGKDAWISNVIPWPATLPDQIDAVQSILAAAPALLAAADIAHSFKGKRAATVNPVLDALAGLGIARRLNDGRYAA